MGKRTLELNSRLYDYLLKISLRDSDVLSRLRDETDRLGIGSMQISPDQGQFMALLIKLIDARRIVEIGTFTGYSALAMALAVADDGRIIACDISEDWTAIAQRYWAQASVAGKIELRLAPALATLDDLLATGHAGECDFVFIDADKQNLLNYYERCLQLIRCGGLVAVDNVLWGGSVADHDNQSADTVAIREFNAFVLHDERVDISLVPIGDGLTLARKKD